MAKKYVIPRIYTEDNGKAEELSKSSLPKVVTKNIPHRDLLSYKRLLVLGEPEYGKSRLLKELVLASEGESKVCCYLDLKHSGGNLKLHLEEEVRKNKRSPARLKSSNLF